MVSSSGKTKGSRSPRVKPRTRIGHGRAPRSISPRLWRGVRFKDRDLAFTPFKRPRSKTIRPSTPASTRSSPETRQAQPEAPARAWITAWLATALWGARFAKPLSTPTQPTRRSPKGDISTWPEKGTFLLCLDSAGDLLLPEGAKAARAPRPFSRRASGDPRGGLRARSSAG